MSEQTVNKLSIHMQNIEKYYLKKTRIYCLKDVFCLKARTSKACCLGKE